MSEAELLDRLNTLEGKYRTLAERYQETDDLLQRLVRAGLGDMMKSGGGQLYGGGIMRIDNTGGQIKSTVAADVPSWFWLESFVPDPLAATFKGWIGGFALNNATTQSSGMQVASHAGNATVGSGAGSYLTLTASDASSSANALLVSRWVNEAGKSAEVLCYSTGVDDSALVRITGRLRLWDHPTTDPATLADGELWYDSTKTRARLRSNGVTYNLATEQGTHRQSSISYISGTGTAGVDNTAQTVKSLTLPANTLTQVGDRLRIRAYWAGTTGGAITATTKVGPAASEVTISHSTDAGGTSMFINEVYLHYIDNTHANIIETENGVLGSLSAPNVAGFDWDSDSSIIVTQDAIADNHIIVYAVLVDVFPKGVV